jgi:hypothetical protein
MRLIQQKLSRGDYNLTYVIKRTQYLLLYSINNLLKQKNLENLLDSLYLEIKNAKFQVHFIAVVNLLKSKKFPSHKIYS